MRIHFIGIGGIGISALAQYYLAQGDEVFGSDLCESETIELLRKKGAHINIGPHKPKNVPDSVDLVIHTPAVRPDNPELKQSKAKILSYPEALGELTKKYFTIAISGMHGKSTITAMLALIMEKAGIDPTVIMGTKLKEFGNTNFRKGNSQYLLIEADEYAASFLNYWPKIIVISNIEEEHLDYYKNFENICKAFKEFISHLPADGKLIINADDKRLQSLISSGSEFFSQNIIKYGFGQKEAKKIKEILQVPGDHNVSNALAALAVARVLQIPDNTIFKALSEYQGAWRRFEILDAELCGINRGTARKITIVSDYGHHPTEIKATLKAARERWPEKKIWLVYQPHQYERTYYFFDKFAEVFGHSLVDKIILLPVYDVAGRENAQTKQKANSQKLTQAVIEKMNRKKQDKEIIYIESFNKAKQHIEKNIKGGEIVFIMGAGDIYNLFKMFST